MIRGVQKAKARTETTTKFLCLSNSNSVYINTILKVSSWAPGLTRFILHDMLICS